MPTKIEKDAISGQMTTGHEWDGLKELNTPLPRWWLYTFYATIVFAAVWVVLYPAIPIRGLTGVLGYTAREAGTAELAEARTRAEPMMARLRAATPARIGLGRAGDAPSLRAVLEFQMAHAEARDAVHAALD